MMQKPETGLLDTQAVAKKPVITKLLEISIDEEKKIYVNWPADKKEFCIVAMAEAIKLVETYQQPVIIKPKPSLMDFVRGVKR
jgi:hypothetical protein